MSRISRLFQQFMMIEVLSVIGLWTGGLILTLAQAGYKSESFFTYRIIHFDHTPAWIICSFILIAIGGFAIFRWAVIAGRIGARGSNSWRDYSAEIPLPNLKIIGINLVSIPALLILFMLLRANNF